MWKFAKKCLFAICAAGFLAALPNMAAAQANPDKASAALQQEFNTFIAKFRTALKANDAAAVSDMTQHPFYFNDQKRDATEFRAKAYPFYFTARNRACLQRTKGVYDRDGKKNENFFLFCGEQIFVFTKTPQGFLFTDVSMND